VGSRAQMILNGMADSTQVSEDMVRIANHLGLIINYNY